MLKFQQHVESYVSLGKIVERNTLGRAHMMIFFLVYLDSVVKCHAREERDNRLPTAQSTAWEARKQWD